MIQKKSEGMVHPCSALHSHSSLVVSAFVRKLVMYVALKENVFPQLLLGHFLLLLRYLGQFVLGGAVLLVESKCEGAQST